MAKQKFTVDLASGLLIPAVVCLSPNCDERPDEHDISLLVIHNISLPPGEFGGGYISDLFSNQLQCNAHPYFKHLEGLRVSSHLLIRRTGEVLQYVPFHKRAWHAGESVYHGRPQCNDYSIGIELEGGDDIIYTNQQYRMLSIISDLLIAAYPGLSTTRITGHCDISPQRKTDPGAAFDWHKYLSCLTKQAEL